MKQGQYSDEQIVKILQQADKGDKTIAQICQEYNFSVHTFYRWRKHYGNSTPAEIVKNRDLEKENARLKRLLAERDLEVDVLKEILQKKSKASQTP